MKAVSFAVITLTLWGAQPSLGGGTGSEVGGGGRYAVDVDGRPALREFVRGTHCEYEEGPEFFKTLSHFPRVLSSVERVNWYLMVLLRNEASSVTICMTDAPLGRIPTTEADGVISYRLDDEVVAIRINQVIYLRMPIFKKMSTVNQAYVMTHELLHSFIPMEAERRPEKIESMTAMIRKNEASPMSPEHFALQVSMNHVTGGRWGVYPWEPLRTPPPALEPYKSLLLEYLDSRSHGDDSDRARLALRYFRESGQYPRFLPDPSSDADCASDFMHLCQELLNEIAPWRIELFQAIKANRPGDFQKALDRGIDPNWTAEEALGHTVYSYGFTGTPLGYAIAEGHYEMLPYLLGLPNLDPNKASLWGTKEEGYSTDSPILIAIRVNAPWKVMELIARDPRVEIEGKPFWLAAATFNIDAVKAILKARGPEVDTNRPGYDGRPVLMSVVEKCDYLRNRGCGSDRACLQQNSGEIEAMVQALLSFPKTRLGVVAGGKTAYDVAVEHQCPENITRMLKVR